LAVQGGAVVPASTVTPVTDEEEDDTWNDGYPPGMEDPEVSFIAGWEYYYRQPYEVEELLDIARDAVLIAAHRAKINNEWDAGVLRKLAVAIRDALEPFVKEPAAEAEKEQPA
jgi:hypothetical protein